MCSSKSESTKEGFDIQLSRIINGHPTEIVFQPFVNRWFLLITQYGKLPNLFNVEFDVRQEHGTRAAVEDPHFHQSIPITITCNFGADKDELRSAIQFLVNKSTKLSRCPTEFVISLGLKDINASVLREVVEVLDEIIP